MYKQKIQYSRYVWLLAAACLCIIPMYVDAGFDSGIDGSMEANGIPVTFQITSADLSDPDGDHVLDSITIDGTQYADYILPDSYDYMFANTPIIGSFRLNGVDVVEYGTATDWRTQILPAFTTRDLNDYQIIGRVGAYTATDYYELTYDQPILVTAGGFVAYSERGGNNAGRLEALNASSTSLGTPITVNESDYTPSPATQYIKAANIQHAEVGIFPLDDLAPVGSAISAIRVYPTLADDSDATRDAGDGKVFIFGDRAEILVGPPPTPDLATSSDSGVSDTDDTTNDNTPTIVGECIADGVVTLFINGTTTNQSTTCSSTGTYSFTTAVLPDGSHAVTARQVVSGITSDFSSVLTIIVDTVAPVPSMSIDTSSIDQNNPIITPSAVETGSGVSEYEIMYIPDNGGAGVGTATTSTTTTGAAVTLALDPDAATKQVSIRATDRAGNSAVSQISYPVVVNFTQGTLLSSSTVSDIEIVVTSPTGNDITNLQLTGSSSGGTNLTCVGSGNDTSDPYANPVTCQVTNLTQTGTLELSGTDAVLGIAGTNQQSYVIDTTPPAITIVDDVSAGPVSSETLRMSVTDVHPAQTTYRYGFSADNTCDVTDTYTSTFISGAEITLTDESQNGNYLCVQAYDQVGNSSYQRSAERINVDSTGSMVTLDPIIDVTDRSYDQTLYPVSGQCTAGDGLVAVSLVPLPPTVTSQSVPCASNGTWSTTFDVTSVDEGIGTIVFDATQTDSIGNVGDATDVMASKVFPSQGGGGGGKSSKCRGSECEQQAQIPSTPTPSATVEALLAQLRTLQAQLADLRTRSCPYFTQHMRRGDRDGVAALSKQEANADTILNEVALLQRTLKTQDFYSGPVNGSYGPLTEQSVRDWQVAHRKEVLDPWGLQGPTGWFYQSSERWMNILLGCPDSVVLDNGVVLN